MFGVLGDLLHSGIKEMWADERQEDAQQFATGEAAQARAFTERMDNTYFQRRVKDLEAANLNPMLAYMNSAGSHASATPGSAGIASPGSSHSMASGLQSASQIQLNEAVEKRTKAETDKIEAERKEIEAKTPTHAVSIEQMRQNIDESVARIQEIGARITLHGSSAAHAEQQVRNLQETIPLIREQVQQARALTQLNKAQAVEAGARTTVSDATYDEIRQRTRENLPRLEAALKELEAAAAKLAMPGRGMDAAASQSFLGAWRAAVRALTGQQSILGK